MWLERARDGTVFIDGLAEMSIALQQRLLCYLDEVAAAEAPPMTTRSRPAW